MVQILVGIIVAFDEVTSCARIRLRGPVNKGDLVRIVGGRTNKELKLDVAGRGAPREIEAYMSGVEAGDMVLRLVSVGKALAAA